MGAGLVILESGGGAQTPAPAEMIAYTKKMIDIPLVVAGGVRNEKYAYECIKAGADIVHVGTALENQSDNLSKAESLMKKIADAVRRAGKEKIPGKK